VLGLLTDGAVVVPSGSVTVNATVAFVATPPTVIAQVSGTLSPISKNTVATTESPLPGGHEERGAGGAKHPYRTGQGWPVNFGFKNLFRPLTM
jgi:hypothetical protein